MDIMEGRNASPCRRFLARRALSALLAWTLGSVLGVGGAHDVAAQEGGSSAGRMVIGFRKVNVGGESNKYREDVNLEGGPRLEDLDFSLFPGGPLAAVADRIRLHVDDLGGEPFESVRFEAGRRGHYAFRYDRHASDYFYDDQLFPESEVSALNARAGDFQTFDFRRVRDRATLDLEVTDRATVSFGFDRYRKTGRSTIALSLERDEFELGRPVDESSHRTHAGFQYRWDRVTLGFQGQYEKYENAHERVLPGRSVGAFPNNQTVLDNYLLEQPYHSRAWSQSARVVATPLSGLTVRLSGGLQGTELHSTVREAASGIGFSGTPFAIDRTGEGAIEQTSHQLDIDFTYLFGGKWGVVGGTHLRNLDQDGELVLGGEPREGRWEIRTRGFEGGIQWAPLRSLDLSAGMRSERREVEGGAAEGGPLPIESSDARNTGVFASAAWRPLGRMNLVLDFDDASIDDPYTLASASDRRRIAARSRYTLENGLHFSGSYQFTRIRNLSTTWEDDRILASFRLGYSRERLDLQTGYSHIATDRRYEAEVAGTSGPPALFEVDYRIDAGFLEGTARFRPFDSIWVGGELRFYENRGSFAVSRRDLRLTGEARSEEGYLLRVGVRRTVYERRDVDFDDYDATLFDVGVGYAW